VQEAGSTSSSAAGRKSKQKPLRKSISRKVDPATGYAQDVVSGKIVAGPYVRAACQRHLDDLKHGHKRGLHWDVGAATHVLGFFSEALCLAGGQFEGVPFELHPSQQFIVASLFGWKQRGGRRRFTRAYIEEGKGNGKSPLLAGIGLYGMTSDGESRAEIYAAGAKRDQAMVLFRDAVAMVEQSPDLSNAIVKTGINPVWSLAYLPTASFFRPIANDDSQSGPRPYFALCDEIHEHKNRITVDMLERGFKSRREPMLIMATNSGSDRNSFCWEEHEFAVRVVEGRVKQAAADRTFAYVCSLDKDDDPLEDSSCWIKANPLLGTTITHEYLKEVVQIAKAIPGKLNGILRLHFCVWTDAEEAWMARSTLEQVLHDFDPRKHFGEQVHLGIDLSASTDLSAVGFAVKTGTVPGESGVMLPTLDVWIEAFTPEDTLLERALRDQAPYDEWVREGWLHAIPGKTIRMDFIAARLAQIANEYLVTQAAYDRYAFRKLEEACDDLGLGITFVEHPQGGKRRAPATDEQIYRAKLAGAPPPQGLWMPGSVLAIEQLILEKRVRLHANPVLISACMSAVTEADAFDNRWFSKRKATNRIDPLVAAAMAIGSALSDDGSHHANVGDFLSNAVII
jgi:phage terminase large subunit-like protein